MAGRPQLGNLGNAQAVKLAQQLQAYWNKQPDGWTAKFWVEACVPDGGLETEGGVADHVIYVVRSNLVNGRPPAPEAAERKVSCH